MLLKKQYQNQVISIYILIIKSTKLPDSDKFSETCSDLKCFLTQLQLKLAANNDHFSTINSCLTYVVSWLEDITLKQITPHISDEVINFTGTDTLYTYLKHAFEDLDSKATARKELFALKQINKKFAVFIAEFNHLAAESKLSNDACFFALGQAISSKLHEFIIHHKTPDNLQEYINLLQDLDSCMQANQAISNWKPTYQQSPLNTTSYCHTPPVPSTLSAMSHYTPAASITTFITPSDSVSNLEPILMNLSTAYTPVTSEKKLKCHSFSLCLYCGQAGHTSDICAHLKCYNCQKQGHIFCHCIKPQKQWIHELTVKEEKTEKSEKE